jgi:hypothetical protein
MIAGKWELPRQQRAPQKRTSNTFVRLHQNCRTPQEAHPILREVYIRNSEFQGKVQQKVTVKVPLFETFSTESSLHGSEERSPENYRKSII